MTNKEEDEMIQKIQQDYTIDEEAAQKIINARPIKVRETKIPNDLDLNQSERIAKAKKILESDLWK